MPQRAQPTDPSMSFRLGAIPRMQPGVPATPLRSRHRLLAPMVRDATLTLREEEVPREGARATRVYQLTRWIDGTTLLWLARRKSVGRGEGSSGLRFDTAEPSVYLRSCARAQSEPRSGAGTVVGQINQLVANNDTLRRENAALLALNVNCRRSWPRSDRRSAGGLADPGGPRPRRSEYES